MRFTIRDLLWLTVVVALGAGWWIDSTARDRQWRALLIRALKGDARHELFTLETPTGEVFNVVPNLETRKSASPED